MRTTLTLERNYQGNGIIDISKLRYDDRKLKDGLIAPAIEETYDELADEHAADPIKSIDDINAISEYLISNGKFRDNMMFIVGINFGLRVSDLRALRFSNLINDNFVFKNSFPVFEKKTRNTRKRKKNRYITINKAVRDAVVLYLENTPQVKLSDCMFRSQSNRGGNLNKPLTTQSIARILKGTCNELGINARISTHTLRKTFGYHQMVMSNNDNRKLLLLQKIFNHSSPAQTLDYIGITGEEIEEAYRNLNLGSTTHNYLVDSDIVEFDNYVA